MRATGVMIAIVLRGSGARVTIADCDPICALQACMKVLQVETIVSEIDIIARVQIDMVDLEAWEVNNIMPCGLFRLPVGHGVIVLASSQQGRCLLFPQRGRRESGEVFSQVDADCMGELRKENVGGLADAASETYGTSPRRM